MLPSPMRALRREPKDRSPDELHLAVLTGRTKRIKHLLRKGKEPPLVWCGRDCLWFRLLFWVSGCFVLVCFGVWPVFFVSFLLLLICFVSVDLCSVLVELFLFLSFWVICSCFVFFFFHCVRFGYFLRVSYF